MADGDHEIRLEHLLDDVLGDVQLAAAREPEVFAAKAIAPNSTLENVKVSVIRKSLEAHGGNVSATARAHGVSRNTIYRKMNLS